jgi:hypothetical protein
VPLSPAGQALGLDAPSMGAGIPGAGAETDEQRKKRLLALQQTQAKLGAGASPMSAAGMALGLGGYGGS